MQSSKPACAHDLRKFGQIKQNKKVIDQHAAESWPYRPFYSNQDMQRPAVRIGPDILIDLTHALECGVKLHRALYQAAHHQGLQATTG